MRKTKEQKGITLVALVITIILLLILAGISIQAITNQGLFGRANEAKRESEIANIKEQIALDIYEKQLEPPLGSITDEQLETILGKYGTVNKEDGKIVGITTEKGYEILLKDIYGGETVAESVPDGAVVTPINDITTWLKTGEISKQYSYTTIEQVIADSTCTESLMNNENAMKYLARSTEFADAICESETAMTYLGQSAYVDDTVLNSDIWTSTICNSSYIESMMKPIIPTMTSNTCDIGKTYASSTWTSQDELQAYRAFDNNDSTGWASDGRTSQYIVFQFNSPITPRVIKLNQTASYPNNLTIVNVTLQYSSNGTEWHDLMTITPSTTEELITTMYYSIPTRISSTYFRLYFPSNNSVGTYPYTYVSTWNFLTV